MRGWTQDGASRSAETRELIARLKADVKSPKKTRTILSFTVGVFFTLWVLA